MRKIMAVVTPEKNFAERFCAYVNGSGCISLKAVSFSSPRECLRNTSGAGPVSLLLCDERLLPETEGFDLSGIQVVKLSDTGKADTISMYQKKDELLKSILSVCSERQLAVTVGSRVPDRVVYAVWSVAEGADRLAFSLSLTKLLSRHQKTLYLNFQEFTGFRFYVRGEPSHGLSSAAYYLKQGKLDGQRLTSLVTRQEGIEFLAPADSAEDLEVLGPEDILKIVRLVPEETAYEAVVVDLPGNLNRSLDVFRLADRIMMPVTEDPVIRTAAGEFEEWLEQSGRKDITEKLTKILLPKSETADRQAGIDAHLYGAMGDKVREVIG